jgi:WD40 repeat protein/DNA-binding SARP family transcriptional activator/class 3 adenylate cyclase/tRNA A-37 threonylcarbamoyl transferase component Bud32
MGGGSDERERKPPWHLKAQQRIIGGMGGKESTGADGVDVRVADPTVGDGLEAPVRFFLVADIRGYTAFTSEHGDEAAAALATRFARMTQDGIEAGGGSVVEVRGDEILATFDSPRRAISTAVQLQLRLLDGSKKNPEAPLPVGIGIDAGEAVSVGDGYRGGALNLAARLCGEAGPGEILCSQSVVHLARAMAGITFEDRGDLQLKGLTDPVRCISIRSDEVDVASELKPLLPKQPRTLRQRRRMQFRILGPLEVEAGAGPLPLGGPKQRAVLAHLLIRANELVPADTLIDEIWGDEPPSAVRSTLQGYVSHLRRAIGHDRILSQTPGYRLKLDPSELDSIRFDTLLKDARRALPKDPGVAASVLDEALQLWRGSPLSDVAQERSLLAEAARLDELRLVATEERFDALMAIGEHALIIGELETLISREPLRERLWGQLMVALYREGRQADALNAFQRAREVLADELGIDPSPELVRLHERILKQDPALDLRGEPLRGYRLLEKIGDGPIGSVFRAVQPKVGRDVVVKIIHEEVAGDPSFVRRFEQESQAVAALEHPHIVPIYDYWREPAGAYVVSRYLRGGTLRSVVERSDLEPNRSRQILEQITSALAFVHRDGVGHGDVKPSNILLDGEGNAYLGDFRIAVGPPPTPADDIRELAIIVRQLSADLPPEVMELLDEVETGAEELGADELLEALRGTLEAKDREAAPVAIEARNPYKGLRPFMEADARDFFGRRELTARLSARLTDAVAGGRFLAVVGPSGSGKSSVVRAGLVPAVRHGAIGGRTDVFVAEMLPGPHPIEELEAALLRVTVGSAVGLRERLESGSRGLVDAVDVALSPGAELLLLVDQFEEVFTLTRDEREREMFLEQLRVAAVDPESRLHVVVTLRADFYDRPLVYPRLGELLANRTEAVPALTPDELEQAIRGPAEEVGVHPEPGLVAQMIADVSDQPGALPLVQYALTELFERRDGDRMTSEAYREIGGVAGALSSRAERVFASSGPEGKRAIKQVFLRLVTLGEGRQDTRRRVTRSELESLDVDVEAIDTVLDAYGRHRLLTFDREPSTREPTVEIAHEALLGAWLRFRRWIDTARADLRQEGFLARASSEWRGADRDPSFLLQGTRLQQAEAWAEGTDLAIGSTEREYLKASVDRREADEIVERERAQREVRLERRSRSRLRVLVAVLTVAALVASTLTVIAVRRGQEASQQSRVAFARELAAASVANLDVDAERSILLALEAIKTTRMDDGTALREAEEALHQAVTSSRIVRSLPSQGDMLDWSPDGSMVATEGKDESGLITIRDARTGEPVVPPFRGHDPDVNDVIFSPDSSMLATTGDDGDVRVWDTRTGEEIWGYDGKPGKVWIPSFSPDGSLIAAPFDDEDVVRIWDLNEQTLVHELKDVGDVSSATAFSPDGSRLAFTRWGWFTSVVDVGSGKEVMRFGPDGAMDVAWSPNGRGIATAGGDGVIRLWDGRSGASRYALYGHRAEVVNVDWSPDSARLVSGSADGTARIWQLERDGGREILTLLSASKTGFGSWVWPVFSPAGDQVMASAGTSHSAKIWDVSLAGDAEWANVPTNEWVSIAEFTADGRGLITSDEDEGGESATIWDSENGRRLGTIGPLNGFVYSIDVSSDGSVAEAWWDEKTGEHIGVFEGSTGDRLFGFRNNEHWYSDLEWSEDGTLLAIAREDGITTIVDPTGNELAVIREDRGFRTIQVRLGPDGRLLATARESSGRPNPDTARVTIWDWRHGKILKTLPTWARDVAFDPTGTLIATGSITGLGEVWDAESGRRLATLQGHSGNINAVEFSPDGTVVTTAGVDGTVRLWDPRSGVELLVLSGHDQRVWDVAFSPDGSKLASTSEDGTVRVWALELNDLIKIAKDELTRGFTEAECRQYLHLASCPA